MQESSGCLQLEKRPQATGPVGLCSAIEGHQCMCIHEGSKCQELERTKYGYFPPVNLIPCVSHGQSQQAVSEPWVQA